MKQIIFNTQMVKAILEGNKTQTRRPIKIKPSAHGKRWEFREDYPFGMNIPLVKVADIGDILYVREMWGQDSSGNYIYRADYFHIEGKFTPPIIDRWHASIHMPKEAARIFLKVTDVRVEHIQDILYCDAVEEGILNIEKSFPEDECIRHISKETVSNRFKKYWDNIYAKRGYEWIKNPWVWVIEFERVERDELSR